MNSIRRISLAATFLVGCTLAASSAFAEDQGFHPVGHAHPVAHPHAPAAPGFRRPAPGFGFHRGPGMHVRPFHSIIVGHVPFARFTPAQRALWTRGHWSHRWWHGRFGWWWYAGGTWFWYAAPVYPYPTVVSDYYYEEPDYSNAGPTWWYCYNPAGYYPYVPNCFVPWTPVPAQGYGPSYGEQGSPDQGPPPGDYGDEQGPPPGYGPPSGNEQGPPPGYDQGPPGNDQGPPPGYDQGPPPGYDQGPPPGDQGPPPGEQGPPPGNGH